MHVMISDCETTKSRIGAEGGMRPGGEKVFLMPNLVTGSTLSAV